MVEAQGLTERRTERSCQTALENVLDDVGVRKCHLGSCSLGSGIPDRTRQMYSRWTTTCTGAGCIMI